MSRPPQKPEPLTLNQLQSMAMQLREVAEICDAAVDSLKRASIDELLVLYRPTLLASVRNLKKIRDPIKDSTDALDLGVPFTESSVSPRSVRRTDSIKKEAQEKLARGRAKNRKPKESH